MFRMGKEEIDAITRVVESGNLFRSTDGNTEVSKFETEWAQAVGSKHALLVSGGTGALIAALVGLGVGPGDEVIVPAYTFMASAMAVLAVGAIPVITDINESMTLDPAAVEANISDKTKAIMPVHICGFPSAMDELKALAKKHGIKIVEDACQADGGKYKGKNLGTIGDAGAFSFNFFKVVSAGEGGGVVTDDDEVYERALIYHDGGAAFRPYAGDLKTPVFTGTQMRVGELTGAFMRVQLTRMNGILADLKKVKNALIAAIDGTGLEFAPLNDANGECATTIAFQFCCEEKARKFAEAADCGCWLPIDSGKHVYTNWSPILERRGAHCDALNPFLMRENQGLNMSTCSAESCPKTLEILKRTVYISLHSDWDSAKIAAVAEACKKGAAAIQ